MWTHHLAPTLRRNDTVVMDNLPAHKAAGVREAIEARGAVLRYLPQYSPDLRPDRRCRLASSRPILRKMAERNQFPPAPAGSERSHVI